MVDSKNSLFYNSFLSLPNIFYSQEKIEPLLHPKLVVHNTKLATEINLDWKIFDFINFTAGHSLPNGAVPLSQKYCGHQFGIFNPDLGDGRGVLLGRFNSYEFHLKGSGKTAFSRFGDGRATLSSSIREYIISEALHHLGIPTTRALALVTGSEKVVREQLQPRAILLRLARTHIRFGHFEWLASIKDYKNLTNLANFVIQNHYAEIDMNDDKKYSKLLVGIVTKTAIMIAHWQAIGFCHGVMNTDNFSILGETFDFGPYAFMGKFQSNFICNSSDTEGRYAFNQQPIIGYWNVQMLAWAFSYLVNEDEKKLAIETYINVYNQKYIEFMCKKLGLNYTTETKNTGNKDVEEVELYKDLIGELLASLEHDKLDYTVFFRSISCNWNQFANLKVGKWLQKYLTIVERNQNFTENYLQEQLSINNPILVPRNNITKDVVLAAEQGDYLLLKNLMIALQNPYQQAKNLPNEYYQATTEDLIYSCSA